MMSQQQVKDLFDRLGIKKENPSVKYKIKGKINSTLYKAEDKKTKKLFTMKNVGTEKWTQIQHEKYANELVAVSKVSSDYKVMFVDAFEYSNHNFLVMEMMPKGSIIEIIKKGRGTYSEEFCKYTLFCVAKGI